jgi:hypothetical protein
MPDETELCQYVFPSGIRCKNQVSSPGYCLGHPPQGGKNRAAWMAAIASAVSATMATITVAWPHLQPIIHTWLQTHMGFMSRAEILIQDVLDSGDEPTANASIQKQIDLLLEEAADLQRAVYASQPVSATTKKPAAAA